MTFRKSIANTLGLINQSRDNVLIKTARLVAACVWLANKKTARTTWTWRLRNGAMVRLNPALSISSEILYTGGCDHAWEIQFLRKYLRPGDAFVDGGAHNGVYSLYAATAVGDGGKVLSFECEPKIFAELSGNVGLNRYSQIQPVAKALAAEPGTLRFAADMDQQSRVETGQGTGIEVEATTLDAACVELEVAAVKLDIEGYEYFALKGADRLLSASGCPVWIVEMLGHGAKYGHPDDEIVRFLAERGFFPAAYESGKELRFLTSGERPTTQNVLFIYKAAFDRVAQRIA